MGLTVALESLLTNSATMVFRGGRNGHKRLATESEKYLILKYRVSALSCVYIWVLNKLIMKAFIHLQNICRKMT